MQFPIAVLGRKRTHVSAVRIIKIPSYWIAGQNPDIRLEDLLAGIHSQKLPFAFHIQHRNKQFEIEFIVKGTARSEKEAREKAAKNLETLKSSLHSTLYDFHFEDTETSFSRNTYSSGFCLSGIPAPKENQLNGYIEAVGKNKIDSDYFVVCKPAKAWIIDKLLTQHAYESLKKSKQPDQSKIKQLEEKLERLNFQLFKTTVLACAHSDISQEDADRKRDFLKTVVYSEFSDEKGKVKAEDLDSQTLVRAFEKLENGFSTLLIASELIAYISIPKTNMSGIETYSVCQLSIPPKELVDRDGPILGVVLRKNEELYPCKLSKEDLFKHATIFGITGSGKTVLAKDIAQQTIDNGMNVCIFDRHGEYRELLARTNKKIAVLNHRITPYTLALLEKAHWLNLDVHIASLLELFQLISEFWGENMTAILRRELYSMYEQVKNPKLSDLVRRLEDMKRIFVTEKSYRDVQACDSLINRIEPLTFGELAQVFNAQHTSLSPEFIINNNVIFEVNAFGVNECMDMLSVNILKLIADYKFTRKVNNQPLQEHVILLEEAQNVVRKGEGRKAELIEKFLSEMRKFRESLILVTQRAAKVSEDLIGNVNTIIVAEQQLDQDKNLIARSIGTTKEEQQHIFELLVGLPTFYYIIRINDFERPFMVKGESWKTVQYPTDQEVRRVIEENYQQLIHASKQIIQQTTVPLNELILTNEEKAIVDTWTKNPNATLTEIYNVCSLSIGKASETVKQLVEGKNLFRRVTFRAGKTYKITLVLTERGKEYFGKQTQKQFLGEGKEEHELGRQEIIKAVTPLFEAIKREVPIHGVNSKTDLLAVKGKVRIAVEYETGLSSVEQIERNYQKNLIYDLTIFAAKNDSVKQRIIKILQLKKKVFILTVEELKKEQTLNKLRGMIEELSHKEFYHYQKKKFLNSY